MNDSQDNNNQNNSSIVNIIKPFIKKYILQLCIGCLPVILPFVIIFFCLIFMYFSWASVANYLGGIYEGVSDFTEKFGNYITLSGWKDNEEVFYDTLKTNYNQYHSYSNKIGELDVPLLTATVHFNRVIAPESYADNDKEGTDYDTDANFIDKNQAKTFYEWANSELGNFNTLNPFGQKLIGALVNRKAKTVCMEDDFFGYISKTFGDGFLQLYYTLFETYKDSANVDVFRLLFNAVSYVATHEGLGYDAIDDFFAWIYQSGASEMDNIERFFDFSEVDFDMECGEGMHVGLEIVYFNDYEKYNEYLAEYFVPQYFMKCESCKWKNLQKGSEEYNEKVEEIIEQIYDLREYYYEDLPYASINGSGLMVADASGFQVRNGPPSLDNAFYYSNMNLSYPTYQGQCTWYAFGRANEILAGSGLSWTYAGDAKNWFQANLDKGSNGFKSCAGCGCEPKPGAIVVWGGNTYGHVAVVERVYESNGTIAVDYSDSNRAGDKQFHYYTQKNLDYMCAHNGLVLIGYIYLIE